MKSMLSKCVSLAAALLLSACGTLSGHLGVPVGQETADYKVEWAGGVLAQIRPGNAAQSSYRSGFSVLLKTATSVESVKVERITNGQAEVVIDDRDAAANGNTWKNKQPAGARAYFHGKGIGGTTWVGQTAERDMTQSNAPWLYARGSTHEHYRITIRSTTGRQTVLEQPTFISESSKQTYRRALGIR